MRCHPLRKRPRTPAARAAKEALTDTPAAAVMPRGYAKDLFYVLK